MKRLLIELLVDTDASNEWLSSTARDLVDDDVFKNEIFDSCPCESIATVSVSAEDVGATRAFLQRIVDALSESVPDGVTLADWIDDANRVFAGQAAAYAWGCLFGAATAMGIPVREMLDRHHVTLWDEVCADCGGSTAVGSPDPHECEAHVETPCPKCKAPRTRQCFQGCFHCDVLNPEHTKPNGCGHCFDDPRG